jgi:hypothetical protein
MPKVIAGNVEFESVEDYVAVLEAWEEARAPFKAQVEALADEFVDYLYEQGLSKLEFRQTVNDPAMTGQILRP